MKGAPILLGIVGLYALPAVFSMNQHVITQSMILVLAFLVVIES